MHRGGSMGPECNFCAVAPPLGAPPPREFGPETRQVGAFLSPARNGHPRRSARVLGLPESQAGQPTPGRFLSPRWAHSSARPSPRGTPEPRYHQRSWACRKNPDCLHCGDGNRAQLSAVGLPAYGACQPGGLYGLTLGVCCIFGDGTIPSTNRIRPTLYDDDRNR